MDLAMNKHILIALALSLLSIAGQAQSPTFRTETTVVQLPVRVLDAKGGFVRDLTVSDIEVLAGAVAVHCARVRNTHAGRFRKGARAALHLSAG